MYLILALHSWSGEIEIVLASCDKDIIKKRFFELKNSVDVHFRVFKGIEIYDI